MAQGSGLAFRHGLLASLRHVISLGNTTQFCASSPLLENNFLISITLASIGVGIKFLDRRGRQSVIYRNVLLDNSARKIYPTYALIQPHPGLTRYDTPSCVAELPCDYRYIYRKQILRFRYPAETDFEFNSTAVTADTYQTLAWALATK